MGARMILASTYRGHSIRVVSLGAGPYSWSYSIDDDYCTVCEDAEFNTEDAALRDGHTSALLHIDRQQYVPRTGNKNSHRLV